MSSITADGVRAPAGTPHLGWREVRGWAHALLRAPVAGRTWRANCYTLAGALLAVPGTVAVIVSTVLGVGLTLTFLGLPLLALGGLAALRLGGLHRRLAAKLLDESFPAAPTRPAGGGVLGRLQARLADPAAWRARLYLVLKLPVALLALYAGVIGYVEGVLWLTYPLWWVFSPPSPRSAEQRSGLLDLGTAIGRGSKPTVSRLAHQLTIHFGALYLDTWPRVLAVCAAGTVALLVVPWLVRGMARLDLLLMRALLGPTARSQRVARLEAARNLVAEDAAGTLRRIERDLHDGTQAHLVALAMNLGAVRDRLEDDPVAIDPGTLDLLVTAHDQAVDALDELRNIARGIHPPALDVGLANALLTLTARSAVPTVLRDELRSRPSDAIATIAYYAVAELLTNAAKHSGAESVEVLATEQEDRLAITVTDDGHGGAGPTRGTGSGLSGLATRLGAVDGSLTIHSPPGGPTAITVDLPLRI